MARLNHLASIVKQPIARDPVAIDRALANSISDTADASNARD
jgi:hypothetical protein